jgi:putative redox protein
MVTMTAKAESNLKCTSVHGPSGVVLQTDAPKDVGGEASSFSPTDLVSVGLLTCIITTMGLVANKLGVDLTGTTGSVEKIMTTTAPRRIEKLVTTLELAALVTEEQREKLEHAAHNCPVHHSLHPDIEKEIVFNWA